MRADLVLAIDVGTQSARALIFDPHGALVQKASVAIEPYFSPHPGWAEQHAELFWDSLCQACHKLERKGGFDRERIAGLALTTQRATVVNVDASGIPLRPAIIWLDQRSTQNLQPVGGLWGALFRLAGARDTVAYLQSEAEANWIATHQPKIWEKTHKFILLSGYLTYKLVGRFVDSVACQVGYIPFDYKALRWARKWDWKWRAIIMDEDKLPELVPPAGQLGQLTQEAAEATGLAPGLPVIAAAADKATEVLGAGCLDPHVGCLSYGTTATVNTTHQKYFEVIPLIPPYPAAVPKAYSLEVQIFRGFWMVNWFRREFGLKEELLAEEQNAVPEELFDDLVDQVPPGSMGLVLQPYWSPGLKVPGPEAKGAMIGFGDVHTRAHIYRAILEGLAYALREGMERTVKRTKVPITELRVAGGGSQSNAAMQVTADVFGLPAARPHVYEASGLGAAIDAAVGLGLYSDFDTAVKEMTHLGDVFEPAPAAHRIYDELYRRVYCEMYRRLKPLYDEIRDITGYPRKN
jgi:sugar (pentulose or hexulose) kinase